MSEIDQIFSSKGKVAPVASTSSLPKAKKKKATGKKRKRDAELADDPPARSTPETIIDSSAASAKRPKVEKKEKVPKSSAQETDRANVTFTDSRGSRTRLFSFSSRVAN